MMSASPHPRADELGLGLAALLWGSQAALRPDDPALRLVGIEPESVMALGLLVIVASLILAVGCRINGRWRWSPVIRAVGVAGIAAVSLLISVRVLPVSGTAWAFYALSAVASTAILAATARDIWMLLSMGRGHAFRH